jgi:hypothetical protein
MQWTSFDTICTAMVVAAGNLFFLLLGYFLRGYADRIGFNKGRLTQDLPILPDRKQTMGQPALSEYSPWDDAMGDDNLRETVEKK